MLRRLLFTPFVSLLCALAPLACAASAAAPVQAPPADATAMVGFIVVCVLTVVAYVLWIRRQQRASALRQAASVETDAERTER